MKKKLLYLFGGIFGVLSFIFSLIFNPRTVFADGNEKIYCYGQEFELGSWFYLCEYNFQEDRAFVMEKAYWYGKIGNSTRSWQMSTYFQITEQDELDTMIDNYNKVASFCVDRDAYDVYEDDALSYNFIVVAPTDSLQPGHEFYSNTISGLVDELGIMSLVIPTDFEIDTSQLYIGAEEDSQSPVISGLEAVYITNIDDPVTVSEIKSHLSAVDNIDGDISNKITVFEDNYSGQDLHLGSYTVVFDVADSSSNHSKFTVTIQLKDIVAPTISGPDKIDSTTSDPIDANEILELFTVTDNYESSTIVQESLSISTDKYTTNKNTPGTYEIILQAVDTSHNIGFKKVNVVVTDDTLPVISGTNTYTKSLNAQLKISNIMLNLVATDNVDGDISNKITVKQDGYSEYENVIGEYVVIFTVKDSANNSSADFPVTITVNDDVLPIFYVDSSFINISQYESMNKEDILHFLMNTNVIEDDPTNVSFITNEYDGNENNPGLYNVSLKVNYEDGESKYVNLKINVLEDVTINNQEKEETQDLSFFDRLMSFFQKIAAFFSNLISKITAKIKKVEV